MERRDTRVRILRPVQATYRKGRENITVYKWRKGTTYKQVVAMNAVLMAGFQTFGNVTTKYLRTQRHCHNSGLLYVGRLRENVGRNCVDNFASWGRTRASRLRVSSSAYTSLLVTSFLRHVTGMKSTLLLSACNVKSGALKDERK